MDTTLKTNFASLVCFGIFLVLAGASSSTPETPEETKTRIINKENISGETYDARLREYGSYSDYKDANEKGMSGDEYRHYKTQTAACRNDWRRCGDNGQLINNWEGMSKAKVACKLEAEDRARYKTEWPWLVFGNFFTGKDYVTSGKMRLVEKDASFQNGFGAMAKVTVYCSYDLNQDKVVDVQIFQPD